MILYEIKNKSEMKNIKNTGYIISVFGVSSSPLNISIDYAEEIIKSSLNPVYLKLNLLYHDKDYPKLIEVLDNLKGLKGIIFQDLGLVELNKNYNLDLIYDPGTFNTVVEDVSYFKNTSIESLIISREISLSEIKDFVSQDKNMLYGYHVYGKPLMFYSLRKHFTSFRNVEKDFPNLKDKYDVFLKEETRNEFYPTYEDENGFFIFRDETINVYEYLHIFKNVDYLILDRPFISDKEYFDTLDLYLGSIDYKEYKNKYPSQTLGYFFKEMGVKLKK